MNYKIIADEQALLEFIEWLPSLNQSETFYLSLLARSKYLADKTILKGDKCSLRRVTSDKKYLYRKIKQMECEVGAYEQDGVAIPQAALALYITINPRCQVQAAKRSLKQLADVITAPYNGYNIHQLALSNIQQSMSRKVFFDIDYDHVKYEDVLPQLEGKINFESLYVLQTHGGFHLLVELEKVHKQFTKTWYKHLTGIHGADVTTTDLVPVCGAYQGGFIPKLIKL